MTEAELLEALREAHRPQVEGDDEGALTVFELEEVLGRGNRVVRRMLRRAIDAGKVEAVRVTRTNIIGQRVVVPGYRPKR